MDIPEWVALTFSVIAIFLVLLNTRSKCKPGMHDFSDWTLTTQRGRDYHLCRICLRRQYIDKE